MRDKARLGGAGVAIPKKAKQHSKPASAAATLDELESVSDRIANWLNENQVIVLGVGAAILVIGGAFGFLRSGMEDARIEASAELAAVERDYRSSMGAQPSDLLVREPANPETALAVRTEYVERFRAVGEANAGSAAGALAMLQAGVLQQELGSTEEALATWVEAAEDLGPMDTLTALVSLRIAGAHEDQARWVEAGEAFETAAAVTSFPLRYGALADAARCFAEAGDVERAVAAYARVEAEAPDFYLPEHVEAQLRELKASRLLD